MAELAINSVLVGDLPRPTYPEALSSSAAARWRDDALLSAGYARTVLAHRGDVTVALANGSRALIELAHSRAAQARRWVINEKGLVSNSGLDHIADGLAYSNDAQSLSAALRAIEEAAATSG